MTTWYQNSTAGFLNYSMQASEKPALLSRLDKFSNDSTACSNALLTGDIMIGFGPGINDGLFDDIDLNSPITVELQNQTVLSDNTNISCYLAAINPLAPLATLRALLSKAGISTRPEYEKIPERGKKMYAVASSYYFSLALYPAVKSSAEYSGVHVLGHDHFFFSTVAMPNPEYQQFFLENLRDPLMELLFFEGPIEEAQSLLIEVVKVLSEFDFSNFTLEDLE